MPALNNQLNTADQRLVTILDAMLVGIVIIDQRTHTIVFANDESASMMDCQATDLLGHVCHSFICPVVVGKCPLSDLRQEIDRSERCVLNREGRQLPILKTVRKIEFSGCTHYLEMFMDITELREKERLQGVLEMAGAAAHHLSQPLQALIFDLDNLSNSTQQSETDRLKVMLESTARMQAVIKNIQKITRYQTKEYIHGTNIVDIDGTAFPE